MFSILPAEESKHGDGNFSVGGWNYRFAGGALDDLQ
jgi:hypothetical protein